MGNRDDFFDDDLFGDDEEFEDDLGGDDDFSFDDDEDFAFDDDEGIDSFDDIGGDEDFFEDEEVVERTGPSRTFIILAGMMILLMVVGLIVVLILATRPTGPSDIEITRTAIAMINETAMQQLAETQVKQTEDAISTATQVQLDLEATQTADVVNITATAEAIVQQTADAEALIVQQTADAEALIQQQTADAADLIAQQTADAQATIDAGQPVQTEEGTPEEVTPSGIGDVALTATAIVEQLLTPQGATLTPGTGGGVGQPTPRPGQLPDTGLLDNSTSASGLGAIMLAAFGLVGIIFGARRLRAMNDRD